MHEVFPFSLLSSKNRAAMALPILFFVCFSVMFYFLFFGGVSPSGSPLSRDLKNQQQRSAFHFQPPQNWMNDPNGPLFYKGYYHLFYQWNPYAAVWGNITWGHVVSRDMIHWQMLEPALVPDQYYDIDGCWTGSATILDDGKPVIIYTGGSNLTLATWHSVQMQAMAKPADYDDPLLRKWTKTPESPIITAPPGIDSDRFRDPTTAWRLPDGKWRLVIGSQMHDTGLALLYKSSDFVHWEKMETPLHSVNSTGMWECPDFYPVPKSGNHGLDTSVNGADVMHVLKASYNSTDFYAVGTYFVNNDSFVAAKPSLDIGLGLRYDYGKYYASKSFYDSNKDRRIVYGWVMEADTQNDDIAKGWASLQAIPRSVWLDPETNYSLLQWPISEVESLRKSSVTLENFVLDSGAVQEVKGIKGSQLDVEVFFGFPDLQQAEKVDVDLHNVQHICSKVGSNRRGVLGPFGIMVLASSDQVEQTAVFFYIVANTTGYNVLVCSDQSRSTLDTGTDKIAYGSFFPVGADWTSLQLRSLVDHSIVETYAQGGKVCITIRAYPQQAIEDNAFVFIFNNGTTPIHVQKMIVWEMDNVEIVTI